MKSFGIYELPKANHESFSKIKTYYWDYACPIIRSAFADSILREKVFPQKQTLNRNFITSPLGISGLSLRCYSNTDGANVFLYISKASKEKNKIIFDNLYYKKVDIERQLSHTLEWNRMNEYKSSKVVISLPNVNIGEKSDWEYMAKFQAEWARKFYDVFLPYLIDLG